MVRDIGLIVVLKNKAVREIGMYDEVMCRGLYNRLYIVPQLSEPATALLKTGFGEMFN